MHRTSSDFYHLVTANHTHTRWYNVTFKMHWLPYLPILDDMYLKLKLLSLHSNIVDITKERLTSTPLGLLPPLPLDIPSPPPVLPTVR